MGKPTLSPSDEARLARLELFVDRMVDVAETLETLAANWGGEKGDALAAFARRVGKIARDVRSERGAN